MTRSASTAQNTTWAEMLAVWKEADDIDVFESGWVFDHFYPIKRRLFRARASKAGPTLDRARPSHATPASRARW